MEEVSRWFFFLSQFRRINGPCKAADEVVGASAKASRSRRTDDDCFNAELNREFYSKLQQFPNYSYELWEAFQDSTNHLKEAQNASTNLGGGMHIGSRVDFISSPFPFVSVSLVLKVDGVTEHGARTPNFPIVAPY